MYSLPQVQGGVGEECCELAAVLTKVHVVMRCGKELRFESDQERTVQPGGPEEPFSGRFGLNRTACPIEQRQ